MRAQPRLTRRRLATGISRRRRPRCPMNTRPARTVATSHRSTTDARRRLLPVLPETSAERQRLLPVLLETLGEGQRLLPVLLETLAEGQRLLPVPLETLAGKQVPLHRRGLRAMAAVAVVVVNTKAGVEAETGVPGNRAA